MGKKKTHDEYVKELSIKNPNVEVIGQYINSNTAIMHHCLTHDIFWETTPSRALQGVGCKECKRNKFRKTRCKTHDKYIEEVKIFNPTTIVIGQYVDARTPIEHYCKKHNVFWDAYPDNILRGIGCKECGNEKIGDKNAKSHDEYAEDLYAINPSIEVVEKYLGANIAILHRCKIDGYVWSATPANILFGKGCPRCKESKGERQVRQWLDVHNISHVYQKTFADCKDVKVLPFDFYVPKYNTCIEYDGEQHFRPVNFDGKGEDFALKQFNKTKYHDNIKTKYCKDNNINLLRIPYYKNVEEELNNFLFI